MNERRYAGFWIRVAATLIDTILLLCILPPLVLAIYGLEETQKIAVEGQADLGYSLLVYLLPAIVVIVFWIARSATPGKMLMGLIIVDAETGGKPSIGQCIIRYIGYIVSSIPFCLGILWVAFDRRKRGWHDKIADTLVIHKNR